MAHKLAGLVLLVFGFAAAEVLAQQYPVRPIRVVVAQSAGSSLDAVTRIVTNKMSEMPEMRGQQLVVDNRGGAGGTIGAELGSQAAPDGYTLVSAGPSATVTAAFTYKKLAFDTLRDFDPVSAIVDAEAVLVVHPSVPAKSVKELIALARSQPGKLNMASGGVASSSHLAGVMFASMAGIDTVHVPYKGAGAMSTSIIAGESQWCIAPAAALVAHIKVGRMRALALSSKKRSSLMPDLPTIAEAGVPNYAYTSWNGFFVPKGTPRSIIKNLHALIQKVLAAPDVKQQYATVGLVPMGSASPEEFTNLVREDYARVAQLVKIAGIKPE